MHTLKRNACTIQPERMHNDLRSACTFLAAYAPEQPESVRTVSGWRGWSIWHRGSDTGRRQKVFCLYGRARKERSVCKRSAENCKILQPVLIWWRVRRLQNKKEFQVVQRRKSHHCHLQTFSSPTNNVFLWWQWFLVRQRQSRSLYPLWNWHSLLGTMLYQARGHPRWLHRDYQWQEPQTARGSHYTNSQKSIDALGGGQSNFLHLKTNRWLLLSFQSRQTVDQQCHRAYCETAWRRHWWYPRFSPYLPPFLRATASKNGNRPLYYLPAIGAWKYRHHANLSEQPPGFRYYQDC